MALDSRSLNILIAKDSLIDPQWISSDTMAVLQDSQASRKKEIHIIRAGEQHRLDPNRSIAPLLPFGAGRFIAGENGILALQSPMNLAYYSLGEERAEILLRDLPPAGELQWGPKQEFMSWIESEGKAKDTVVTYSLSERRKENFLSQDGYMRFVAWNPQRPVFAFLSWDKHQMPWLSARLMLGSYALQNGLPKLQSLAKINPPGLESAPVAETLLSPCGRVLFATIQTGEFFQIWRYEIDNQTWMQLTSSTVERALPLRKVDSRCLAIDPNGSALVNLACHRGFWQMEKIETKQLEKPTPIASALPWTCLRSPRFSPDGQQILAVGSAARQTPAIIRFQKEGASFSLRSPSPQTGFALEAEPVSWPGSMGQAVHGILYRDRKRKTPSPLLMPLHGGPTDFVDATWPAKAQAFVQQGYALLYVNYRGSWGYGRSYQKALEGRFGQLEVDDCAAAAQSLASLGWIDPTRVALWGGGIASYSVLWGLIRYPKIFSAGIAVFPLCNLEHYLARCPDHVKTELLWALGQDGWKEKSPLAAARHIQSPLALFHGAKDPFTSLADVEALAASLQERQIPCWLTTYAEEGNSWQSAQTYEDYYFKIASFLARFLRFRDN